MKKLSLVLSLLLVCCSGAERAKFAVWVHPYLVPMVKEKPAPVAQEKTLSLRATPGEYEPAAFAVRSDSEEVDVTVSLEGSRGALGLPVAWCELHKVVSMNDSTQPNRLFEFTGPVQVVPGRTQFFWITVHPPAEASPGTYTGKVTVKSGSAKEVLDLSCEVLPFKLTDSPITGGAFMCLIDLPPGWYRDMKEHGLDAIQFFTWEWAIRPRETLQQRGEWEVEPIKITRQGDKLVLDFTTMDKIMGEMTEAGMKGPVVVSLGNDHHLFYECRLADEFGLPIDTGQVIGGKAEISPPITPKLDSLFVDGLRQIRDHWKAKAFPQELVILIYDEPTERLLARCKNRYDLIKTVMPEVRVYGVVMNRRAWAESMLDQMDIIVCNGDFEGNRELATQKNKGFWVYSGFRDVNSARYNMGCMPWRANAEGVFFWMYNYWFYDPDACVVYQGPDDPAKIIRSTPWESLREGMDDLRYFATAEKLIGSAPAEKKEAAAAQLAKVKESLDTRGRRRMPRGQAMDEAAQLNLYNLPQNTREEVIKIILELL